MLRRKDTFTVITPIPGFIPRQLAIDILHSHSEVITLNPLVIDHKPIAAPQNAETDEYYSTWYEITERLQLVPGIGKMGSSTIKFNGCFHDMPWGLQTHVYAPMNIDMRSTYRIAGNQPGVEPPEVPEIGLKALGAPSDGLYLREDIEIKCNVTMVSYVRSQMKKASAEMVHRMIKKAELLDAGVLSAMIEDGKLKTHNPADRRNTVRSPLPSPSSLHYSPSVSGGGSSPPQMHSPPMPYQIPRMTSVHNPYGRPGSAGSQGPGGIQQQIQAAQHHQQQPPQYGQIPYDNGPQELPGMEVQATDNNYAVEMPGDFVFANVDPNRPGQGSPHSQQGHWSNAGSRPTSYQSSVTSPSPDLKGYPGQLAPHQETNEEHQMKRDSIQKSPYAAYNPADYAKVPSTLQSGQQQQQQQYGHGQLAQRYGY
ncbi:hypothetical protein B0T21DRAFT_293487 [Apiosordaria backusii]|uniref:DUF7053 domain-containing protein n=1 Tax=Apiosordaria backusii TaxID=314023 RepID=A0AA40B2G8_9PEZI|nr:hypothetical protein B0T21DRAFT_293487 [Apiosordaria backusii]